MSSSPSPERRSPSWEQPTPRDSKTSGGTTLQAFWSEVERSVRGLPCTACTIHVEKDPVTGRKDIELVQKWYDGRLVLGDGVARKPAEPAHVKRRRAS